MFEFFVGDKTIKRNATMVFQNTGRSGRTIHAKVRERTKIIIGNICEAWQLNKNISQCTMRSN